jgi:hypothetical protein
LFSHPGVSGSHLPAGEYLPRPGRLGFKLCLAALLLLTAVTFLLVSAAASLAPILLHAASILMPVAIIAALIAFVAFRIHAAHQWGIPQDRNRPGQA